MRGPFESLIAQTRQNCSKALPPSLFAERERSEQNASGLPWPPGAAHHIKSFDWNSLAACRCLSSSQGSLGFTIRMDSIAIRSDIGKVWIRE